MLWFKLWSELCNVEECKNNLFVNNLLGLLQRKKEKIYFAKKE